MKNEIKYYNKPVRVELDLSYLNRICTENINEFNDISDIIIYDIPITGLEILPSKLKFLRIKGHHRKLTYKFPDTLPDTLEEIYLSHTYFENLSKFPRSLKTIRLTNIEMTELFDLPPNLEILDVHDNKIKVLPKLNDGLKILIVSCNEISTLPNLPKSLTELTCSNNSLSELPKLPPNLKELICYRNRLTKLPELPYTLCVLDCERNKIKSLPLYLPKKMHIIECQFNKLDSLPLNIMDIKNYTVIPNPITDYIIDVLGSISLYISIRTGVYRRICSKIENWYIEHKDNPRYEVCRKRLRLEYEELYGNSTK